jgi:hypothetical protein
MNIPSGSFPRHDRRSLGAEASAGMPPRRISIKTLGEGAIKSVEDLAEKYVPGFKGSEYGKTPIRDLLHMSSGVEFGETKNGQRDLNRLWIDMVRCQPA